MVREEMEKYKALPSEALVLNKVLNTELKQIRKEKAIASAYGLKMSELRKKQIEEREAEIHRITFEKYPYL